MCYAFGMADENVTRYFNDNAAQCAALWDSIDRAAFHSDILPAIDKKAAGGALNILDIGAGSGADAAMLAERGHHVLAVDPSEKLLEHARVSFARPGIEYLQDELPALEAVKARGGMFDVVFLSAVWQYIHPSQWKESLETIRDLCRPGALVLISYPTPPSREYQHAVDFDAFKKTLQEVNEAGGNQLAIADVSSKPDPKGRLALNGAPLSHWKIILGCG
jgi:2-polyprenyl-3-methyl-5-hydroxy-6-metoxy-1,4-benzoquinol methylase